MKNRITTIFQFACFIAAFFLLIKVTAYFLPKYDLTTAKEFTLSDYTEKLLQSEKIQSPERDLKISAIIRKSSPHFQKVEQLLKEYNRLSTGKIKIQFLDPLRESQRVQQLIAQYKIKPSGDLLIIDSKDENSTEETPSVRFVSVDDLVQYNVDQNKQRKASAYQIEDQISSNLLSAVEGERKKLYLIADNTSAEIFAEGEIGASLNAITATQNVELAPLSLKGLTSIPVDASGVLVLAPQYDFEPNEMALLSNYWNQEKSSLFFILDPEKRPKRIRAFLRLYGITLRNDRLVSLADNQLSSKVNAFFSLGVEINDTLQGKSTLFEGIASSLDVREAADDLLEKRITPFKLIETSEEYYGERRYEQSPFEPTKDEDTFGSLCLAAAVIKGNEMNDQTAEKSSRLIAISTKDFLKNKSLREEQVDFIKNNINWLVGRSELIGIGPRHLQTYKLNLIEPEIAFVNRFSLLILPLTFLIIGGFIWNSRRS